MEVMQYDSSPGQACISDLLTRFPDVAVLGPRQVGKTTLALRLVEELGAGAVWGCGTLMPSWVTL